MNAPFDFACPICKSPLEVVSTRELRCPSDATTFCQIDGIWRLMRPERVAYYERFVKEYETIRRAEGRGSRDSAYYRALPLVDLTGRMASAWRIRAASFRALITNLIAPLESNHPVISSTARNLVAKDQDLSVASLPQNDKRSLKLLDLGAGNGWLSHQLAKRGHTVGAVDLLTNPADGLGAHVHYDARFTPIQAEFDHLPLTEHQVDVAIFNSAFHYSADYATSLAEAWRVVKPGGRIVILDSPVYSNAASGKQMLRERQEQFERAYGFPSNAIASEGFLTFERLDALAASTQTEWRLIRPAYGWRWTMRQRIARVRARREPARFMLIIGTRVAEGSS